MARERILIVDDDRDILDVMRYHLEREGFAVAQAESGEEALAQALNDPPDAILLDLMLPKLDGLEVCRRLKADVRARRSQIVMVTAKGEEADVVVGLELGAADYIVKPFRPRELVARVRAVLRRRGREAAEEDLAPLRRQGLEIDPGRREVRVHGKPVELTRSEFDILRFLAQRPGWVFTRYQIVDGVRGANYAVTDRAVDVQILGLRRKLGRAAGLIETVRGVGYRFRAED